MSIFKLSVKNPVLANMIMLAVIVLGAYSFISLPREEAPEINFNWAFIITLYPGASPEEVEQLITIPIEDEIADVDKINMISSTSSEGRSYISIKFDDIGDAEFYRLYQDLRAEVDKVTDLPAGAEKPLVFRLNTSTWLPVVSVVLSGDLPESQMKEVADRLKEDILDIENVSKVDVYGVRDRVIWVEADPARLQGYGLSLTQLVNSLQGRNLNLPNGSLKLGREEYLLRTVGEFGRVEDIGKVILRTSNPAGAFRVEDIARVRATYERTTTISRLNGKPSITLNISKKPQGNTIKITEQVKRLLASYRRRLPEGAEVSITYDGSTHIKEILNKLQSNAIVGMILVIGLLYLFLGPRNALFAAVGIPVTFLATFLFLKFTGRSLNGNALFGLVLVLGMLVDDAIVIIENTYRYMQKGMSPKEAVLKGTPEVALPVLASVGTTVAAFLPLMLMSGIVGKFMKIIPIVVSLALAASVFEAFFILPSHIAEWGKGNGRGRDGRGHQLFLKLRRFYVRNLVRVLRRRYWAVLGVLVIALGAGLLVPHLGVQMFAEEDVPFFYVRVEMPMGTRLEETDRVLRSLEKIALTLPKDELKSVVTNVGILEKEDEWLMRSYVGELVVYLVDKKDRKRSVDAIIADLRERIGRVPGVHSLELAKAPTGPPLGKPFSVKIKGKYFDKLEEIAEIVKDELRRMPGVHDISDDFMPGKKELRVKVDEYRAALVGLNTAQVAWALRQAFEGQKATVFRDGDESVDVVVKYPEWVRSDYATLENLRITDPQGHSIPFKTVARIVNTRGYSYIKRFDRQRAITISAEVDKRVTSAMEVSRKLKKRFASIEARYPGYKLDFRGEFKEFQEAFNDLGKLFLIGVIIIFLILGAQFKSWIQPLIILFTVPFAFIGAVFGLLVSGYPFSIPSLFGMVALAGVAVNSSIVLVDFINKRRERGMKRWRAIMEAGSLRLRPILLTSTTTIFGLLPMALGIGGKSAVWMPLANTIVWGLMVSTLLTLFIIPSLYAIAGDIARRFRFGRVRSSPEGLSHLKSKEIKNGS